MVKKELNILDDVKEYDRKVRTKIVYKKLDTLKDWARTILELKEKTEMMLKELKVQDEDIKRLIDYVNSQVELDEEDKKDLLEEVRDEIETTKKDKDVQNVWSVPTAYAMNATGGSLTTSYPVSFTTAVGGTTEPSTSWTSASGGDNVQFSVK